MYRSPIRLPKGIRKSPIQVPFTAPAPISILDLSTEIARLTNLSNALETLTQRYEQIISENKDISAVEIRKLISEREETKRAINEFRKHGWSNVDSTLINFKEQFLTLKKSLEQKAETAFEIARTIQKGDPGEPGEPGKNADPVDKGEIIKSVIDLIPKPDETALIEEILLKLKKKKLQIEDIANLSESLRTIQNTRERGGGGGGQGSWKQKALSGTIDGVNVSFTFGGEVPAQYSERVFLNYIEQNPFTDYTISGNVVTYTVAPDISLSGTAHIIRYM